MNTNSNVYTVVYAAILVAVVAGILAFVSTSLSGKQQENVALEKQQLILRAAGLGAEIPAGQSKSDYIKGLWNEHIGENSFVLNANGEKIGEAEEAFAIDMKSQNSLLKKGMIEEIQLPVFVCDINGETINIFPCYGAGLWGPIWGYVAVASDYQTVVGATFDHKSETPGLGGEIANPSFQAQFAGKQLIKDGAFKSISIIKGGAPSGDENGVDAITGATITSKALDVAIASWLDLYQPYFNLKKGVVMSGDCCGDGCGECEDGCSGEHNGQHNCQHHQNSAQTVAQNVQDDCSGNCDECGKCDGQEKKVNNI